MKPKNNETGKLPPAVVMNMFYTGLGIARSLGQKGVPVIGLSAHQRVYGNYTRYAKVEQCPDSRSDPDALLAFLLRMGGQLDSRAVIFPTRDDDLVFLDRFRERLEPFYSLVVPPSQVLNTCLNKWDTYLAAQQWQVPSPKCWLIQERVDLERAAREVVYPCVLKPLSAHLWRQKSNWELVGGRKAIELTSEADLLAEYEAIARVEKRALLQEMVPGGDDCLAIAACYLDWQSRWVTGFNTRKVLQIPERFGTGCIVQSVAQPELFDATRRLLEGIGFSGIAEVEFKWHSARQEYQLIEVNPRPWDQHRLGYRAGSDLMYQAYCEHAGLLAPRVQEPVPGAKWIAEDAFVSEALRSLWRNDGKAVKMLRLAHGQRIYAIWDDRDPLPAMVYWVTQFIPELISAMVRAFWRGLRSLWVGRFSLEKELGV